MMQALGESAAESKVVERAPEAYNEFVKNATKDGPVENVYISGKEFEAYFQSVGVDPVDVAKELPGVSEQLDEALETGGDIRIPLGDYATKIAPTEHHGPLLKHSRFRPEDMSPAEAEFWRETQGEIFQKEAERIFSENETNTVFRESSNRVHEAIRTKLKETGRFNDIVSQKYAALHEAFAVTLSDKMGIMPHEVYEKFGLEIIGQPFEKEGQVLQQQSQQIQQTPEFQKFFEGSKVVDEQGQPLVVFHGTSSQKFEVFKSDENEFFFTDKEEVAKEFGFRQEPVFISLKNPHVIDMKGKTGKDVFDEIDKAKEKGADGVIATNVSEGPGIPTHKQIVAFKPEQIKSVSNKGTFDPNDPNILKQEGEEKGKLTKKAKKKDEIITRAKIRIPTDFPVSPAVIALLENANLTSFLHESGHFFFETYHELSKLESTPKAVKDDFQALLDFVGVDAQTWQKMKIAERRAGHEKVARAFEVYLFEGNAPSVGMRSLFRQFRSWLVNVYKRITHPEINVPLTDEVRGIFDRMLASDLQIDAERQARNYRPIFQERETAGATQAEWEEYRSTVVSDEQEAKEKLSEESLENMKWLTRAKSRILRQLQRENRERRKGVEEQARLDLEQEPIYKAINFLRGPVQRTEKRKKSKQLDPTQDSLFEAIAKLGGLKKDETIRVWGLVGEGKINSGVFGKPLIRKTGGLDLDAMGKALSDKGFVVLDAKGNPDLHDFEDRFFDELSGNKRFSKQNEQFDLSESLEGLVERTELDRIEVEQSEKGKFDRSLLEQIYPGEDAAWRKLPTGRFGMVADVGFHPDLIAEKYGFSSGDELINTINETPSLREAIRVESDKRMLELFGNLNTPEAIEQTVNEALHNKSRTKQVHTEMKFLSRATGKPNVLREAAKEWAETKIGRQTLRDIRPHQYVEAEIRAAKNAERTLAAGKTDEAAEHKRAQVLNHHFAKAATRAREDAEKTVRYFKKFDKPTTRKNLNIDYLDQIDKLLEKFDFKKAVTNKELDRRKSFEQWKQEQIDKGFEPQIDTRLNDFIGIRHYREVPFEELMGLRDSIKNIEHIGRFKNKLLKQKEARDLQATVNSIVSSIDKFGPKAKPIKEIETHLPQNKFAEAFGNYLASHRKIANIARSMDGLKDGGIVWESIIRPLNEAGNFEALEREKATKRFGELFSVYSGKDLKDMYKKQFIPEVGMSLTRMGRLVFALNWGNMDNRQRLMGGYKFDLTQVETVLSGLDRRDWDFVQSVWDFLDEYWEQISEKEKRVTGVGPEKVEAVEVETRFGTYRGGYYPISFDRKQSEKVSSRSIEEDAKTLMQGGFTRATTRRGHTKERVEGPVKIPIRTDFGVMFEHVNNIIHDLAYHETLIDVNRIIKHDDFVNAVNAHYGNPTYQAMKDTINDVAAGEKPAQQWTENLLNYLRNGVTIAMLGWNLGTAVLQPFGLAQSMVRIGPRWVAQGMIRWLRGPTEMEGTLEWIHRKSDFMKSRPKTQNREINEIRNQVLGAGPSGLLTRKFGVDPKTIAGVRDFTFFVIVKAQLVADIPTWLGQYEKSMQAGVDEATAVQLADQAVKDSQSSGQIHDLAGIQRGGAGLKLFTNFYSYFSATYNLFADRMGTQRVNDPMKMAKLAADAFMLVSVPVALDFFVRDALIKGECDSGTDMKCVGKKMAQGHASYISGMMVGPRELSGTLAGFDGYKGPPGTRFFSASNELLTQVTQGKADKALFKAAIETTGILFHLPTSQLEKTILGYMEFQQEGFKNPTPLFFGESRR